MPHLNKNITVKNSLNILSRLFFILKGSRSHKRGVTKDSGISLVEERIRGKNLNQYYDTI